MYQDMGSRNTLIGSGRRAKKDAVCESETAELMVQLQRTWEGVALTTEGEKELRVGVWRDIGQEKIHV